MLNDSELCNVHTECAEIEMWSLLCTKVDYVDNNRRALPTNRLKFNSAEGNVFDGICR